jgi:hypothetical protein
VGVNQDESDSVAGECASDFPIDQSERLGSEVEQPVENPSEQQEVEVGPLNGDTANTESQSSSVADVSALTIMENPIIPPVLQTAENKKSVTYKRTVLPYKKA